MLHSLVDSAYRNTNQPFLKLLLRKYKFIRKFAFH